MPKQEKGQGEKTLLKGYWQHFNHVKIFTQECIGSVAFFLSQILTYHILGIVYVIILGVNTSQISSIYSATASFIITNQAPWKLTVQKWSEKV